MKGLVIINGYPNGEKFLRQGERIAAALCALGVEAKVVKNGEVYAAIRSDGSVECDLPKDVCFAVYLDKDKYLGKALERYGLRLFNSAEAVERCDDKYVTYTALLGKGIPLAKSVSAPLCYTPDAQPNASFLRFVERELGVPLVAKKSYGSFGAGVRLVQNATELLAVEDEWLRLPHFYQAFVAESSGRDIRALVVGGKVVAAMERVAQVGEFRSNVELGGEGRAISLPKTYMQTAEEAAQALGLDYCGVDLLEGNNGPIVCEVNSNAFFEGLEAVTGIDVARVYAEYIVERLAKEKK